MDNRNRSIPASDVTSFYANKAIQRSLTKACARHGLGLYIYAGEDLPEGAEREPEPTEYCIDCGQQITGINKRKGAYWPVSENAAYSVPRFGRKLCPICQKKAFAAEKEAEKNENKAPV